MKKLVLTIVLISMSVFSLSGCAPKEVIMPTFTLDNFPVIDGSTVTIPMDEALMAKLTGKTIEEVRPYVSHNKTHEAYVNLIEGKANLILVTSPSAEESALAASMGVELEIVPIVSEAFIFLTNVQNPVNSLTFAQIVDIYTGKITNWKELGGNDTPIIAFQRPVNSGSQTGFLDLVMKDKVPMTPPSTWIFAGMGDLVEAVANYDNAKDAIGYSYYYFVTDMWGNDKVKLLKVDGIYPDKTTIANGSYPIQTAYYAIFNKNEPANSDVRKIVNWILSDDGQQLMEDSGYVKID
jgi:phosphate transport system substrate-binding protein